MDAITKLLENPWVAAGAAVLAMWLATKYPQLSAIIKSILGKLVVPTPPATVLPPPVVNEANSNLNAFLTLSQCPKLGKNADAQKALADLWSHLRPGGAA